MKKNVLKKAVLIMSLAVVTIFAYGQEKNDIAVGGNISYELNDYNNFGLTGKFQWNITDGLRLEPSASFYFEKDNVKMWDMNANLHYVFKITDVLNLYPLGGLSIVGIDTKILGEDYDDTQLGINFGGGIEYKLTHNLSIGGELRYQYLDDWKDRITLAAGITYRF